MALSEHLLGLIWLTTPLQWLGVTPVATYNIACVVSFALSAWAGHLLGYELTRRHDAAALTGLAFGFAPYRMSQIGHLQVLSAYWMPIALLGLHRFLSSEQSRWLLVFAAAWLVQALCNGYYLVYFPVLIGLWVIWFVRSDWSKARAVALWWLPTLALVVPILLKYRAVHERLDLRRFMVEIGAFSADMTGVLSGSRRLAFWPSPFVGESGEGELFPGVMVVVLVAAAVWHAWRRRRSEATPRPRIRRGVLVLGATLGLVGAGALLVGPWEPTLLGFSISITGPKQLGQAGVLLLGVALASPRVVAACRARSVFAFYVLGAGAMWVFSFGPRPRFLGHRVLDTAPYGWLLALPGFDEVLRVPARFGMLATLCLSIAAGLAFARIAPRTRSRRAMALAVIAVAIVLESWVVRFPLAPVPVSASILGAAQEAGPLLELPPGGTTRETSAMLRSMEHLRPLINGYSGFSLAYREVLDVAFRARDVSGLHAVARHGSFLVRSRWTMAVSRSSWVIASSTTWRGGRRRVASVTTPT